MVSEYGGEHRLSWCFFGLNPCSCGGWSQRIKKADLKKVKAIVLILVLVEDGLRDIYGILMAAILMS